MKKYGKFSKSLAPLATGFIWKLEKRLAFVDYSAKERLQQRYLVGKIASEQFYCK